MEQAYSEKIGLDYCYKLSLAEVERSNADDKTKRDIMYSLLCLRSLFDNRMIVDPDPLLKKYKCLQHPEPQKLDLYDLALRVVRGATTELRAMWYLTFPLIIMMDAPHDEGKYAQLKSELMSEGVFDAVLKSRYSVYTPDTVKEMWAMDYPSTAVDWYLPYLEYKQEKDEKGVMREVGECRRLLAAGSFEQCLSRCEKLLAVFPDDEELLLCDIAARVSFAGVKDEQSRLMLMRETLGMADDALLSASNERRVYFMYYRGLTLLGLGDVKGSREAMLDCLSVVPNFELAKFMLKGIDDKL